jgi:type IV secretory pathway TraG/TraD family ATPase VirD4
MGTTGSGKSTVMRELLQGALKRGDRAVIADPDGGYLSRFYNPNRGDVILNPFDQRSGKWALFAELKTVYDVDQLARAFIPDRGSSDTTWTSYARTFFSSVVRQAQIAGVKDIGEFYRLLTAAKRDELKIIIEGTPAAPFLEEGSEKLFGGVRSTTTDHVKSLDYVRGQRGEAFSVRDWVKSGSGVLFLPYQADQIATLKSIISTWMRLAIFQTMSLGEGDHRIWFAVDELDALGPIDGPLGCAHAPSKVRRPLCARVSVDFAGEHHLRSWGRPGHGRELRKQPGPSLFGFRERRHLALCLAPHR